MSSGKSSEEPKSKVDEYYGKGWDAFVSCFGKQGEEHKAGLSRAHAFLTMAYKEAGTSTDAQRGIAGLTAYILASMQDYKNAKEWAEKEFAINPSNVMAKLAWYDITLNGLIGHRGFVTQSDGSGFGIFASILTNSIDAGRVANKKQAIRRAALDAAEAVVGEVDSEDWDANVCILHCFLLLAGVVDNMWANNMREPRLCELILSIDWGQLTEVQEESVDEIQVMAHGYLGRSK